MTDVPPRPDSCPLSLLVGDAAPESVWLARVCGEPVSGLYTAGCVHEHIGLVWLCAKHGRGPAGDERPITCWVCLQGNDATGHWCPVAIAPADLASLSAAPSLSVPVDP